MVDYTHFKRKRSLKVDRTTFCIKWKFAFSRTLGLDLQFPILFVGHTFTTSSRSTLSVKSHLFAKRIKSSRRPSDVVDRKKFLMIFILLKVLSSFATLTGVVNKSLNTLYINARKDRLVFIRYFTKIVNRRAKILALVYDLQKYFKFFCQTCRIDDNRWQKELRDCANSVLAFTWLFI